MKNIVKKILGVLPPPRTCQRKDYFKMKNMIQWGNHFDFRPGACTCMLMREDVTVVGSTSTDARLSPSMAKLLPKGRIFLSKKLRWSRQPWI